MTQKMGEGWRWTLVFFLGGGGVTIMCHKIWEYVPNWGTIFLKSCPDTVLLLFVTFFTTVKWPAGWTWLSFLMDFSSALLVTVLVMAGLVLSYMSLKIKSSPGKAILIMISYQTINLYWWFEWPDMLIRAFNKLEPVIQLVIRKEDSTQATLVK